MWRSMGAYVEATTHPDRFPYTFNQRLLSLGGQSQKQRYMCVVFVE